MTPKQQVILGYGLMLSDVDGTMKDHITNISHAVKRGKLNDDPELCRVGQLFGEFCIALYNLDCELELLAGKYLEE